MALPKRRTVKRTTKNQKTILDIKSKHPELSTREIGGLANTSHVSVIRTLRKFGIPDIQELNDYKNNRGDVLAGIGMRIANSITDEDIKKMPVGQRFMSYGILYDKERLERGQATSITDDMSNIIDRIEQRYTKAIDVTPIPDNTNDNQ